MAEAPAAPGNGQHILVVGDFIIDRTWLVTDLPLPKRYESHYDVIPTTLVNPDNRTDVAGGVGTIARGIAATSDARVTVVTGFSADVAVAPKDLFPPDGMTNVDRVDFRQICSASFTTLKLRIFASEPVGAVLKYRYDRNLKASDLTLQPIEWPDKDDVSAVIVPDYDFGMLDQQNVIDGLRRYEGLPMILRSPRKQVIEALPWTLLSINLRHLASILGSYQSFDAPIVRQASAGCIYHPDFISALNEMRKQFLAERSDRVLLVRISREAAVLLAHDELTPILLSIAHNEPDGVGSGDVVLGQLALQYLRTKNMSEAAKLAFSSAAVFSAGARNLEWIPQWYTPRFDLDYGRSAVSILPSPVGSLDDLVKKQFDARVYENLLRDNASIRLQDAEWYLPGFLTVNQKFGREIASLKNQIKAYVDKYHDGSIPEHPFLAVVCGEPGAGKSTLARAMARVVGCEVISESAAQWTTAEDLFWLCERIRSIRMRKRFPLAFIDEVDTDVNGEKLYGKLLSPVWDGAYFIRGEERTLGATVFILAGSTTHWRDRKALLTAAEKPIEREEKLPDLVSRLTTVPVEIPAVKDRRADVVYLAAASFVRRFPRVRRIACGILRMLAESECRHGSRSITRVAEAFGPLASDEVVMASDLRPNRRDELTLHIPNPIANWEQDERLINIEI